MCGIYTLPFDFIYVPNDETPLHAYVWTGSISTGKTIFIHPCAATQVRNTPKVCFGAFIYIRTLCERAVRPQALPVHATGPKRYQLDECARFKSFLCMHAQLSSREYTLSFVMVCQK